METIVNKNESVIEVIALIDTVGTAQNILKKFSQEKIDKIVKSMATAASKEKRRLAEMAALETGFGNWQDKVIKNEFASKVLYDHIKDQKTVGILNRDSQTMTVDVAVPMGVVAALIPSTNPTSTTIYKAMIAIKSGNGIVFSPHPAAKNSIMAAVRVVYKAAVAAGAPEGIIGCMTKLSLEGTNELMKNHGVAMILATGGEAMVRAAYSSGNPAIGVGPGNCPAFIEKSADIKAAVEKIFTSKTFDNGVICASEQSIVVEVDSKERIKQEIISQKGYFLSEAESRQLATFILRSNGTMNPQIVGKSADYVAQLAGLTIPEGTRILISEQDTVSKENPFAREKLTPILAFYTEVNVKKAIERCDALLNNEGKGHTASIHSNNEAIIHEYSMRVPVSRCLVNTPSALGGIGATTDLIPALTLGCGAVGGSSTSDNVGPEHLMNVKKVVYHLEKTLEKTA